MSTIWALPNFSGELYTADAKNTPFLSAIGSLNQGAVSKNFEFATGSLYELPAAAQPNFSEDDSVQAPAPTTVPRTQQTNVVQIFHESILITYHKQGNSGRMSGLNTAGQVNNATDEATFQKARKLEKIARDVEFTFINGTYQLAGNAAIPNRSRGIIEATTLQGSHQVDNANANLDQTILDTFFRNMYTNGAMFKDLVLYVNATIKQAISSIYGFAPTDRNLGGVNIQQIETDFGRIGLMLSRFAPANTLAAIELSVCQPTFLEIPNKGILFYEELAKVGAAEQGQMYGEIGLDHGPAFAHGSIINIG